MYVVESGGRTLRALLHKGDPWAKDLCNSCLVCTSQEEGKGISCMKRNTTYMTQCIPCKQEGKKVIYYGETSRSTKERALEHLKDAVEQKEESHMHQHWEQDHKDLEIAQLFTLNPVRAHPSAF